VGEGVYVLDGDGRIIYWNAACEALTGFGEGEVMGSRCCDQVLVHVDPAGKQLCSDGCLMTAAFGDGKPREAETYRKRSAPLRWTGEVTLEGSRCTG
jgi:PAS domain S-box-containing protein